MSNLVEALLLDLSALDLDGLPTKEITEAISGQIVRTLNKHVEGQVHREYSTGVELHPQSGARARVGLVDFVVTKDSQVVVAIEVDRSDKKFSLTKLEHFASQGAETIWVRWGRPPFLNTPVGVEVVYLPVVRATGNVATGDSDSREVMNPLVDGEHEVVIVVNVKRQTNPSETADADTTMRRTAYASMLRVSGALTQFISASGDVVIELPTADILEVRWGPTTATQTRVQSEMGVQESAETQPQWLTAQPLKSIPSHVAWIAEKHPRAYQPWSREEEADLLERYRMGDSITELSLRHKRQESAIESRLAQSQETQGEDSSRETSPSLSESEFTQLVVGCDQDWTNQNWGALRSRTFSILSAFDRDLITEPELVTAGRRYLGSLFASGECLLSDSHPEIAVVRRELADFSTWMNARPALVPLLEMYLNSANEAVLLSEDETASAKGQLASALRRISRPDLAIRVCDDLLERSRLNYYAQATRGAALCDLGDYDAAIEQLMKAIAQPRPTDGIERALNALSRALRLRFEDTGELNDLQSALLVAEASWNFSPNEYAANVLIAAASRFPDDQVKVEAVAMMDEESSPDASRAGALLADVIARVGMPDVN